MAPDPKCSVPDEMDAKWLYMKYRRRNEVRTELLSIYLARLEVLKIHFGAIYTSAGEPRDGRRAGEEVTAGGIPCDRLVVISHKQADACNHVESDRAENCEAASYPGGVLGADAIISSGCWLSRTAE